MQKFLMWFKRIRENLRTHNVRAHYQSLKLRYKELPDKKPNRKQCAEILALIDPDKYQNYTPLYGRSVVLGVDTPNLEAFTKKLLDTSAMVVRETPVPVGWIKPDEDAVQFDRLFVSIDGFYVDVVSAVTKFKTTGLRLCELMEDSDTATHGIYEHNFRMLSRLFVQLRELGICLLEVSLEQ